MSFLSIMANLTLVNFRHSPLDSEIRGLHNGQKQCIIGLSPDIFLPITSVKQSSLLLIPTPWITLAKSPLEFSMVGMTL